MAFDAILPSPNPGHWNLFIALEFIGLIHPIAFECGYDLSLSGGVLIRGKSENNLDLTAIRVLETINPNRERFISSILHYGFKQISSTEFPFRVLEVFKRDSDGKVVNLMIFSLQRGNGVFRPVLKGGSEESQKEWKEKHVQDLLQTKNLIMGKELMDFGR